MTLDTIRTIYPEAVVHFDRTAYDCGYHKPWFVWSKEDMDAKLLGEGKTEAEAIHEALNNLEE